MSQTKRRRNKRRTSGGRRGLIASAAIAAVAVVLAAGMISGLAGNDRSESAEPPTPPPATEEPAEAGEETPDADSASVLQLEPSTPKQLIVPSIGVDTRLLRLNKQQGKQMVELPPARRAGWYRASVTPGEVGVTVIVGYIRRSAQQPGVFSDLSSLHQADKISVRRADGTVAVFAVTDIASYPKGTFPTEKVYAPTKRPQLRLITSGGTLRPKDPPSNVVVYARLVDTR